MVNHLSKADNFNPRPLVLIISTNSNRHDASLMVLGYPENKYMGFNTFSEARNWLSRTGHHTFHFCQGPSDGPKTELNEHSGRPSCYVATDGRETTIFEDYTDELLQRIKLLFLY